MNTPSPAPDEPLSPELVLVLPPELRAEAIANLGPPVWPKPRPQVRHVDEAPVPLEEPFARSLGLLVGARLVQLALIFVAVTAVTLAMSMAAHALKNGPEGRPVDQAARPVRSGRSEARVQRYREGVWKPARPRGVSSGAR